MKKAREVGLCAAGTGALFAVALLAARQSDTPFAGIDNSISFALTCGFIIGIVLGAIVLYATDDAAHTHKTQRGFAIATLAWVLAVAMLAVLMVVLQGTPYESVAAVLTVLAGAAGILLGCGEVFAAYEWLHQAMRLDPKSLVVTTATAVLVCALFVCAYRLLSSVGMAITLIAAACAVCVVACLLVSHSPDEADWRPSQIEGGEILAAISNRAVRLGNGSGSNSSGSNLESVHVRDVWRALWIPLASLLLCAFITGLTWDPFVSVEDVWHQTSIDVAGVALGSIVAAVILIAASTRDEVECFALINRAALLVVLAIVMLVPIAKMAAVSNVAVIACSTASVVGFACVLAISMSDVCIVSRLVAVSAKRMLATVLCMTAISMAAGFVIVGVLGESGRMLCFVIEGLFITAIAVSYALKPRDGVDTQAERAQAVATDGSSSESSLSQNPTGEIGSGDLDKTPTDTTDAASNIEDAFDARCQRVAQDGGLSPREAQVLQYLARGHGSRYIAAQLCISENTVRTHVRHIYEKTGVTSREQLLQMVAMQPQE